jgi:hypothetical protein
MPSTAATDQGERPYVRGRRTQPQKLACTCMYSHTLAATLVTHVIHIYRITHMQVSLALIPMFCSCSA